MYFHMDVCVCVWCVCVCILKKTERARGARDERGKAMNVVRERRESRPRQRQKK